VHVGLLLCDHLDPDVADRVGDYTELFPARFGPAGLRLTVFDVTAGEFPDDLAALDGWLVSGSRHSAYDDEPWIRRLEDLVRTAVEDRRPLAGICFGHQLIARALGGRVERAPVGWGVGGRRFRVHRAAPWMEPAPEAFTILMSHQDQVVELPDGAEVLAGADYCPVGAYRIGEHVFCVQGHPEFVPELSALLMQRRRDAIGAEVVEAGMASLEGPLDQRRVATWIAEFFTRSVDRRPAPGSPPAAR
jgi:GMP synthase-like glutamine amidotransferase